MREGDAWSLAIPPALGYGNRGAPPTIPGGAVLKFELELLKVQDPSPFVVLGFDLRSPQAQPPRFNGNRYPKYGS